MPKKMGAILCNQTAPLKGSDRGIDLIVKKSRKERGAAISRRQSQRKAASAVGRER